MIQTLTPSARSRFGDRWLCIVMVLCSAHALAHFQFFQTSVLASQLSPAPGLTLLLCEVTLLGVVGALLAAARPAPVAWPVAMIIAAILVGGWLSYVLTGGFPNISSITLFLENPGQVLAHGAHIDPRALPLAAVAWLALSLALIAAHRRPLSMGAPSGVVVTIVLLSLAQVYWRDGRALSRSRREAFDPASGVTRPSRQVWEEMRLMGGGAFSALGGNIRRQVRGAVDTFPAMDPIATVETHSLTDTIPRAVGDIRRLNVLLIVIESLRADEVLNPGHPRPTMPTLDRVAQSARRYNNAYATATQTNLAAVVPVSGQYPLRTLGVAAYPDTVAYPRTLLYDLLQPRGWRTGIFSSQNERWWGMDRFLTSSALDTLFDANAVRDGAYVPEDDVGFARFVSEGKASGKLYDHVTVSAAIEWMRRDSTVPFFAMINLQASHLPYTTPPGTLRRFGQAPGFPIRFGSWPRDSASTVRDEYRNALAFIDSEILRLREALETSGQWDSTIVVITGDHGQAFYEHGIAAHANGLWQELVRVPLIIHAPGLPAGPDERVASHIDIAPTVAGLLRLGHRSQWPGERLDSLPRREDRPIFLLVQSPLAHQTGVILSGFKLVRNLETRALSLYDIRCDPGETRDVMGAQPVAAMILGAVLRTWEHTQLSYYSSQFRSFRELPPRVTGVADPLLMSRIRPGHCAAADTSAGSGAAARAP